MKTIIEGFNTRQIPMNIFKYTLIYAIIPLYIGDDLTRVTKENVYSILKVFYDIFSDIPDDDKRLDFFKNIEIKKFYGELFKYFEDNEGNETYTAT